MNTLTKVLISTAAFVASQTEAKAFKNSCLMLSDQTAGQEVGAYMSNDEQLTGAAVSDEMRLHSIKTCRTDGNVTGLQFNMALNPYQVISEELFAMTPLGQMTCDCETLELPEGLDRLKAT